MIKEMEPLSLAEAKKIVETVKEDDEEKSKEIRGFLKKFIKLDAKKAEELKKDLGNLEIIRLKKEHIVKIIDLLPEDASDLNKLLTDVSLDEDEIKKILEVVKKHR